MLQRTHRAPESVHLKAILYCLPGLYSLDGRPLACNFLAESLAPSQDFLSPHSEFTLSLANSSIHFTEVPTCFGNSPSQGTFPPSHFDLKELGDSVQYLFSDGKQISTREILYHAYSRLVPMKLLPLLDKTGLEAGIEHIKLLPSNKLPNWGPLRDAELTLLSILLRASRFRKLAAAGDSFDIYFSDSQDRKLKRNIYRLESFEILIEKPAGWYLLPNENSAENGRAILSFQEYPAQKDGILFEGFELSKNACTLSFHSNKTAVELVYQALPYPYAVDYYRKWSENSSTVKNSLQFPLYGHTHIYQTVDELNRRLKYLSLSEICRKFSHPIPATQVRPHLWIDSSGEFRLQRSVETAAGPIEIWNFPQEAVALIEGLQSGLGATSKRENGSLAYARPGLKRDRDLKVLRHAGFFACIFLETIQFAAIRKSDKVPGELDSFWKRLFGRLGILLNEIEKQSGFVDFAVNPSLENFCSPKTIDFIKDTVVQIISSIESGTESIYTQQGELVLEGGLKSTILLLEAILSECVANSRGQCFLKPRLSIFNSFFGKSENRNQDLFVRNSTENSVPPEEAYKYKVTGSWISFSNLLQALLPLQSRGFNLTLDSTPLGEMLLTDFKPEFNIVEDSNPSHSTETAIDWFELHPKFFFKGVEIESSQLERLSKEGILEFQGKIFLVQNKNLPTIKKLEAFWAKINTLKSPLRRNKKSDRICYLPRNQTLEILALRASGFPVTGGERWNKICAFYDSLEKPRELYKFSTSVRAQLKPYQKIGVQWLLDLYDLGLGGILADDMGLGKTVQTLVFLESLRARGEAGSNLIVVPTSLTFNWLSEGGRFTPDLPIQIFQSKTKTQSAEFLSSHPNSTLICTYGLFTEHRDFFEKRKWNILIFDEAQNLKNISAKRTTLSRTVQSRFKACLTGTPLENHLGEFYSLLDLVVSGSLGELKTFRSKYTAPDKINQDDLNHLRLKTKPLVLRRTKSEILSELPPKVESTIKLPFEAKQEKIYRDIALSWNDRVKSSILNQGESKSQLLMLTALLRLRQACSDPGAIPKIKYTEEPPKLTVLMEALQEIIESGESALVFTQFLHTFDRIKAQLNTLKINNYSLHGSTSRPERERILKGFQETPNGAVLLMTLKTGGVGLNLVKASYVFHIEPWWNPAVENQASDRAHRLGQRKTVQVYRYLMRESVEEKIELLKERKSSKFNALFSSSESHGDISTEGGRMNQADFEYLLS